MKIKPFISHIYKDTDIENVTIVNLINLFISNKIGFI